MKQKKVSLITAVYNRSSTIGGTIDSVSRQNYSNIEHVIVDGASDDGTLDIIKGKINDKIVLISEPDTGIYDALNKGISVATGDIIGFMHSDDFFSDDNVISDVVNSFTCEGIDAVYGDLQYVSANNTRTVIRNWRSGEYNYKKILFGWMPPHPAFFLRRNVIEKWGAFDTRFSISADYDAILRYFVKGKINPVYIQKVLVKMRLGGESNRSLIQILKKTKEDYLVLKKNNVGGVITILLKNATKLAQFF